MKTSSERLIEEIQEDLIIYLKSGKLVPTSFISELNLNISNIEGLLKIHFLMRKDVQEFVEQLPDRIRTIKTSTKSVTETLVGEIKGHIDWGRTIKERCTRNYKDKTIFCCNEVKRDYSLKENLVLKELLKIIYNILFKQIDSKKYSKYNWFSEWNSIKNTLNFIYNKNVYISKIEDREVTDRMIESTKKNRNPLYKEAARLLGEYRRIMNFKLNKDEVKKLLEETFILPEKEEVLFELYWIIKAIKENSKDAIFNIADGSNNIVASWEDKIYRYNIYHNSTGSNELIFNIPIEELDDCGIEPIRRKLEGINKTRDVACQIFDDIDKERFKYFWNGRPDIIVEIREKVHNKIVKIVIGEIKYTQNRDYAIEGLKELVEYMKFVKYHTGEYLDNIGVEITGMLFLDDIIVKKDQVEKIKIITMTNFTNLKLV